MHQAARGHLFKIARSVDGALRIVEEIWQSALGRGHRGRCPVWRELIYVKRAKSRNGVIASAKLLGSK